MEQVKDSGCLMSKKVVITMERTPMFVAALSTIAKTWKHPKCPSDLSVQQINGQSRSGTYTQWNITQP